MTADTHVEEEEWKMKKLLLILITCTMMICFAAGAVYAEDYEYTAWSFDQTTGTLTINTGTYMPDFDKIGTDSEGIPIYDTPWKDFKDSITTIVFADMQQYNNGLVNIGNGAFCGLTNLAEVKYITYEGNTARLELGSIGEEAFYMDTNLSLFMYMNDYAMSGNYLEACGDISETIGARAFSGCTALSFAEARICPMTFSQDYHVEVGPEAFFGVEMGDFYIGGFFTNDATESFTGMHCNTINEAYFPEGDHNPAYYYSVIDNQIWASEERIEGPGDPDPSHEYGTIPWQPAPVELLYDPADPCDLNGHIKVNIPATEATCTQDGLSAGCQCSRCGKTLVYQSSTSALGHDWSGWTVITEATADSEGEKQHTCSRCGLVETEVIPKVQVLTAKIGETEYYTMQAAIAAAQDGDTIVVMRDLEGSFSIPSGKQITIDLNGHKIMNKGAVDTITNDGELLVIDGVEDHLGVVENNTDDFVPIRNNNKFTLSSGTVSATGDNSAVINTGTMTVSGGTVIASSDDSATVVNRKNASLTVSGGAIQTTADYGEAVANAGAVTMSAGTMDGIVSNTGSATLNVSGGSVTGAITATNPNNVTLTGGTYGTDVSAYLDDDQAAVQEGGNYVIRNQIIVTVQSMVEDTHSAVANVSGGGRYVVGDDVTVTAPSVSGYEFKGWHEKDGDDSYKSAVVSDSSVYTFVAESDLDLVAVYGVSSQTGSAVLKVNGAGYKVNGGVTQRLYNYSQSFDLGSHIVLTATDPDFLYWMNSSDKIVSRDPEYAFDLVRDMTFTAVYKNADTNTAFVEFVSDYGQIMQAQNYDANSNIIIPKGPSKSGFMFKKWALTADEIRAQISNDVMYICVTPEYEALEGTFNLTVIYDGTVTEEMQQPGNKQYRINAIDINGKKFSHWEDANGQLLSTSESYRYYLNHDSEIHAVYVNESETVVQIPALAFTNLGTIIDDGVKKLEYTYVRDVPDNYRLVEHGVVRSTNSRYGEPGGADLLVPGAEGVTTKTSSDTDNCGYFIYTLGVGSSLDTVVYVKGYMIVQNESTGEMQTIYTDMASKSYNQVHAQ